MKILLAHPSYNNKYVDDLVKGLRRNGVEVCSELKELWIRENDFDIVHLQWPDSLFTPFSQHSWPAVTRLKDEIYPFWRKHSSIVTTVHNRRPHYDGDITAYADQLAYRFSSGFIHLGEVSRNEATIDPAICDREHAVIPHHIFSGYEHAISKVEARKKLNISSSRFVVLAFGSFRHQSERNLVIKGFQQFDSPKKLLVAPQFGPLSRPSRRKTARTWLRWELANREMIPPRRLRLSSMWLSEQDAVSAMIAADCVLIPRLDTLNSGVLPFAYQCGRPVVGPDTGNIGEILRLTGNFVFDPNSVSGLGQVLSVAERSDLDGIGSANQAYALKNWNQDLIGKMHVSFYRKLLSNSLGTEN